jgi:glyoxylase I family protein
MTFHVERIDHVVLRVHDLPAMVRFYEQALGFNVERRLDRINLVQMRAGASMLDLVLSDARSEGPKGPNTGVPNTGAPNMDHLCFRIEPFDRAAIEARLGPLGVAVGETFQRYGAEGTGPSVYFHDPEGNQIELKGPSAPAG